MSSKTRSPNNEADAWRTDPELFAELVEGAMKRAVERAIAEHHRAGRSVSISRDGKIGRLYPDGTFRPLDEEPND